MPRHTWPQSWIRLGECRDPAWGWGFRGIRVPLWLLPGWPYSRRLQSPSLACRWGRRWRGEGDGEGKGLLRVTRELATGLRCEATSWGPSTPSCPPRPWPGGRPHQVLPAHWAPFECSTQVVPLTLISSPVQEGRPGPGWQEVPQPVKVPAFPHQAGERSQVVAGVRGQVSAQRGALGRDQGDRHPGRWSPTGVSTHSRGHGAVWTSRAGRWQPLQDGRAV